MKHIYYVADGFEQKYVPTLVPVKVLKEGPKTLRVEARYRSRGAMVYRDSVDSPYGAYSSTVDKAWSRYLKNLAEGQKNASREVAMYGEKIRAAIATMRSLGLAP